MTAAVKKSDALPLDLGPSEYGHPCSVTLYRSYVGVGLWSAASKSKDMVRSIEAAPCVPIFERWINMGSIV